jgi:RNA-dependent RNA polymerase
MTAREAAQHAVRNITFTNRLTDLQLIARHAYALTFEKEYVEQWEEQLRQGMWGGRGADTHEYVDDRDEVLRPRSALNGTAKRADDTPRPMISFAWVFWQELVQIATMS